MLKTGVSGSFPSVVLLVSLLLFLLSGCSTSVPSPTGDGDIVAPSPVLSQRRVYVNTDTLHIFDQNTGKVLENDQLLNPTRAFRSSPLSVNGSIYITGDTSRSVSGATTGNLRAVYALQEKMEPL